MSLGHRSVSITLTLTSQFTVRTFIVIKCGIIFFCATLTTAGRFSLYKRTASHLWLVHFPELYGEVCFNNRDTTWSMEIYTVINEHHYP